jgi:hypothetical protein
MAADGRCRAGQRHSRWRAGRGVTGKSGSRLGLAGPGGRVGRDGPLNGSRVAGVSRDMGMAGPARSGDVESPSCHHCCRCRGPVSG